MMEFFTDIQMEKLNAKLTAEGFETEVFEPGDATPATTVKATAYGVEIWVLATRSVISKTDGHTTGIWHNVTFIGAFRLIERICLSEFGMEGDEMPEDADARAEDYIAEKHLQEDENAPEEVNGK